MTNYLDENIARLAAYLDVCKPKQHAGLGVELEHIILRSDNTTVTYDGEDGIAVILERLSVYYDQRIEEDGSLLGLAKPGETITCEPSGQMELSSGPFKSIEEIQHAFELFYSRLQPILDEFGHTLAHTGYNPVACAQELPLIPKKRYKLMDAYLESIGPFGSHMMRCSASLQVSIDCAGTPDTIRTFRLANILAPLLALITENAPIYERKKSPAYTTRMHIWNHVDADRCGIVPKSADDNFSLEDYARWVFDAPACLVPDEAASQGWRGDNRPFKEIYAQQRISDSEIEHALSMEWPDVRLKKFIEIRPADALEMPELLAYCALIKGLFYGNDGKKRIAKFFEHATTNDVNEAKRQVINHG
ncbi:MAG: glutamate--cysteine ligase, partial [Eggerthellaceae bacterium]|nr:glutamate--cysteine ligase [Eggerthellaceae bacterium]